MTSDPDRTLAQSDPVDPVIEDLESLAEFEREHHRLLAMQALYQRRTRRASRPAAS